MALVMTPPTGASSGNTGKRQNRIRKQRPNRWTPRLPRTCQTDAADGTAEDRRTTVPETPKLSQHQLENCLRRRQATQGSLPASSVA